MVAAASMIVTTVASSSHCESEKKMLERQGFDRESFDIYIDDPQKKHLTYLLEEFEKGKNVWPWIWTWRNQNGPHHVFVGTNAKVNELIEELANASERNNLLVITDDNGGRRLTKDPSFYFKHRCGLVENVTVQEIDSAAKIILLSDQRIIAFDELHVV